jgi:(p)ppGpp synthase/HD superfamily hydrolase
MSARAAGYEGPGAGWLQGDWAEVHRLAEAVSSMARARYAGSDLKRVEDALALALEVHRHSKDRPEGPYVQHVLTVAARVLRWLPEAIPEMAAAALLHDAVEDEIDRVAALAITMSGSPRDRAFEALGARFGNRVSQLVGQLTNPDFTTAVRASGLEPESPQGKRLKDELYAEHFSHLVRGGEEASVIKLADFADNALRLDRLDALPERRAKLVDKYRPCVRSARETLESAQRGSPLFDIRGELLPEIALAWERDYAR